VTLSGERLQQVARDVATSLEDVGHGHPFTPHLEVWKVGQKVFLIVTQDDPDLQIITVKTDPGHGDALRRDHESITPGHYLDKRHWISVGAGEGITKKVVEDLVHGSYELVAGHPHEDPS